MKFKILIFTVSLLISCNSFCQKYAKNQFTLFSYNLEIDDKVKIELSPLENLIHFKPEKKQDKIESMLINTLYTIASQMLSDSLNIFILPVNNLSDNAKYNIYGYPNISIQRALKLSDTKYFLKIKASIQNNNLDNTGKKISEDVFKPQISVTIEFFKKGGYYPVQTEDGIASASNPIKISPEFLAGMNFVDESIVKKPNTETLKDIYLKAIWQSVMKFKYKGSK